MYQHSHSALVIMCLSQLLDQASNKLNFVRSLSPGTLTVHLGIFCFWKMTSYETCSGWISKSIFLEAYLVQKVTVTVSSCFGLVTFGFCTLVLECKFLVFAVFPKYFYKNTRHFYNNKAFFLAVTHRALLWILHGFVVPVGSRPSFLNLAATFVTWALELHFGPLAS